MSDGVLERLPRDRPLPLSFAQEQTWRDSRTTEGSLSWNLAQAFSISGPLDVPALRWAIDRIVSRHEILRTTFHEQDGQPVQVVHPSERTGLQLSDVSADPDPEAKAARLLVADASRPFDLTRLPLLRVRLVRLGEEEHQLQRASHHIVSDAQSWRIFAEEMAALYEARVQGAPPPLPDQLPLGYGDYAAWERARVDPSSHRARAEIDWWLAELAEPCTELTLPFARKRVVTSVTPPDGVLWWGLHPEVSDGLALLARATQTSFFKVRLAAFAAQLACDTGQDDMLLATYVGTRRAAGTERMFGFFANPLALRLRLTGRPTFRAWVRTVGEVVRGAGERSELPFAVLASELEARGAPRPAPEAIFASLDQIRPLRFGGLELRPLKRAFASTMPWRFSLLVDRPYEATRNVAVFDPRLHDPERVRAFLDRLGARLEAVAQDPDSPVVTGQTRGRPRRWRRHRSSPSRGGSRR